MLKDLTCIGCDFNWLDVIGHIGHVLDMIAYALDMTKCVSNMTGHN
jgi:hypothetical protein